MHNRRQFLRFTGLASAAALWPFGRLQASTNEFCVLIPSETAGPFPLDLSDNAFFFRQDVREDRAGVQMNLKMKINGLDDCGPMANVRVHIWHCDKDGNYSGYGTETGTTYLRGYQITDANGEVEFISIFPGWYPGRTCHIHFQVYVNSSYAAISQLTWEDGPKNDLLLAFPDIYTAGPDPVPPGSDGVFADGYEFQTASLTPNTDTGGYDSFLELSVQGSSPTGYAELEAIKRFTLEQNFPNPAETATNIPFRLHQNARVVFEVYNMQGVLIGQKNLGQLSAGKHQIPVLRNDWGIRSGNYMYQLKVSTEQTTYVQNKLMMWQ